MKYDQSLELSKSMNFFRKSTKINIENQTKD